MPSSQQIGAITMLCAIVLALALFTTSITAQFGFGGVTNGGGASDPVPILLASPQALTPCYSFSGMLNNIDHPQWGSTSEPLLRAEGNAYPENDWARAFERPNRPNARAISNVLAHETCADAQRIGEVCYNDWLWLWGQYIDHDLTHVPTFPRPNNATTNMNIQALSNDPFLAGRELPHTRSFIDTDHPENHNEQLNLATSYLDSSQIYGSTIEKADSIRTFRNGMLKSTFDGFMPVLSSRLGLDHSTVPTFDELGSPVNKDQFLCADMRCNQHGPMATLQTMYIREHNRIALALSQANHPAYNNDETIFQAARACVIAMNQAITYNEFLPLVLGKFNLPQYTGYDKTVRSTVSNAFATAGWRTLHSMVGCDFKEMTASGQTLRSVNFATSFFDSTWIRNLPAQPNRQSREQNAYQTILNGLGHNPSTRMDHKVTPVLRSVVFNGVTNAQGRKNPDVAFDVVASDVQRGRDHGLLSYREMRRKMGWKDIQAYEHITLQQDRVNILKGIYGERGLDDVDLMVGLLTEDQLDGGLLGPVATSIAQDQFKRTRDGDRCWYENQFQGQLLNIFKATKLRHLVDRNFASLANPFASEVVAGTVPTRQPVTIPRPSSATSASITTTAGTSSNSATGATVPSPLLSQPVLATTATEIALPTGVSTTTTTTTLSMPSTHHHHHVFNPVVLAHRLDKEGDKAERKKKLDAQHVNNDNQDKKLTKDEKFSTPKNPDANSSLDEKKKNDNNNEKHNSRFGKPPAVIDTLEDTKHLENDPEGYVLHRQLTGRSRLDNGRGTRRALPFDETIGMECDNSGCYAVALESDPVLADDPNVIEWLAWYREEKRQQRQLHPETTQPDMPSSSGLVNPTRTTATTLSFNALQNPRNFRTMQSTTVRPVEPAQGPVTQALPLNTGRVALSPSDGILQTDVHARLSATVAAGVTRDNIFLTPQCRQN